MCDANWIHASWLRYSLLETTQLSSSQTSWAEGSALLLSRACAHWLVTALGSLSAWPPSGLTMKRYCTYRLAHGITWAAVEAAALKPFSLSIPLLSHFAYTFHRSTSRNPSRHQSNAISGAVSEELDSQKPRKKNQKKWRRTGSP